MSNYFVEYYGINIANYVFRKGQLFNYLEQCTFNKYYLPN